MDARYLEYARLLIRVGLNVQKGQTLLLTCPVDCAWFARLCAQEAYAAGCREVVMRWNDDAMTRMKFLHAEESVFDELPRWQSEFYNGFVGKDVSTLYISASDPENLAGVDHDRIIRFSRVASRELEPFEHLQNTNVIPWCSAAMPIPAWAKKVFPGLSEDEAMDRLWEAIFQAVRVEGKGDAVEKWQAHQAQLRQRVDALNALKLQSLHYQNRLGTDLTVRLPEGHLWAGGSAVNPKGQVFLPNMPTEEVFTAPHKDGVDGVVCAAMPLVCDGAVIEGIRMELRAGRIVKVSAEKGEDILKDAVALDEGASRLGEVALVPYDSPIRKQELLFFNTLFDENAACHLAFGAAYPECIQGGEEMNKEELSARGLNVSDTHVDFMIGTRDLSITGLTHDGRTVKIFENGNFAL